MGIAVAILLNGAINASAQTVTDVTSTYLTNADLSSGSGTGWTKTGNWTDNSGTANGTVYVSENYAGWGALDQTDFALTQSVTLPAGLYKIDAYALYRGTVGNVLLSATSASKTLGSVAVASAGAMSSSGSNDLQKAANSFNQDYAYLNTVYFYLSASTTVTIGYVGTHTEKQQWFVAGPMKLYKYADDSTISSSATLDFTSLIFNPSFESGNTNGWTTTASSDTGARSTTNDTYKMSGSHGNYLFNTWWKGTPCTQTLAYLPAGQYELSSVVASDGATIYLINGDNTNDYAYTETTDSKIGIPLKKSFLLTSDASNYKIGVVGGADGTAGVHKDYQADGYWWYKCDNFTLTYKGNGVEHYATSQGGDAAADTWYVQNITVAGSYTLTTNGSATIVYTQNPALEPGNVTATASNGDELTLAVGAIYYKASAATPLTIAAASYTYEVGTATVDYAYVQGGETVTVTYADAVTNDPSTSFAKNGNPTITFGGNPISVNTTSNGFTFTVPAVTAGTSYTLSIPANAFGYAEGSTYNAAQEITIKVPAIFDGTYFFKDDNDKFWLRGEPYGSAVQVYDWGMPVKVTTDATATTLQFADANDWKIFSDGTGIYADNASPENGTWNIIVADGKYKFQNTVNNHYMKVDGTRILSTATAGEATAFTLVTPADHQDVLTAYVNAQASDAATAAGLSAATPSALATAAAELNEVSVITGSTAATTAEKWQGGQWDSRTVYSNTVSVSTPGLYKFTLQGFYRMTDNDATYALHTAQADCPPVYVFFGDAKTPIKSVMDESRASAYDGNNNDYAQDGNHYPNQQASSLVAFQEGKYVNTVWAYISAAGEYTYGIQYLGWAGSHSEWTCYTTESISLTLYSQDWWGPLQAALSTYAPYNDVVDATDYTTHYNTYAAYTQSTPQSDMLAAITYMQNNYANYQWANASIAHPVDVTEGIISGWECTANDAWPGSGRTTATGTYYDGTSRTYFTQNHENGAARSQDVTIPEIGAYLLRTIVRPVAAASYATITIGSESTTTRGIQTGSANIGNGWAYNDIYFATTSANESKTISISLSNANSSREADCGEMHLYYIGQNIDFVKEGIHRYIGTYASAPAMITLTDEVPVADIKGATFTSGSSALTFTNPNGLVFANAAAQVSSTTKNVVVNGTCSSLQLEKGHPFINPTEFTATAAQYTMVAGELAGGSYATLMIPFAASLPSGGSAYTLDQGVDVMGGTMRGTTVSSITTNQPVLVTASGNYTGSNVTVPVVANGETHTYGELVGVYQSTTAPEGSYVLQNHTGGEGVAFYIVGSTKPTVNPFRAYIKSQTAGARALFFLMEEEITGINTISNEESVTGKAEAYDLQGRRTKNLKRGMYIINGKKIIVK